MATTTFTNVQNPNPGLEDVLDIAGVTTGNATTFSIVNNNGGSADGFVFRLEGTGFTYNAGNVPITGIITSATILNNVGGSLVASIAGIDSRSLPAFYGFLQFEGVVSALSALLAGDFFTPVSNIYTGSSGRDRLTTFGIQNDVETLNAGGGNDVLTHIGGTSTLIGGTGNDTFLFLDRGEDSFFTRQPAAIHGSAANGSGGGGAENDTIITRVRNIDLEETIISNIDGVLFADPPGGSFDKSISFAAEHVGNGLSDALKVTGSGGNTRNDLTIQRNSNAAANLDLSDWQFVNFSRENQTIRIQLTEFEDNEPAFADRVVGSSRPDRIDGGNGNDILQGGGGGDSLNGGRGNDIFIYNANEAGLFEDVFGDAGFDIMRIRGSNNFSTAFIGEIERIQFFAPAVLTFDRDFPDDAINIVGNANVNRINVVLDRSSTVTLERLTFQAWTASDIVSIAGSLRNDDIVGSPTHDVVSARGGQDVVSGNNGNDAIRGGDGIDSLSGDAGNDTVNGEAGIDTLEGGAGNDTLNGGSEADTIDGGTGNDAINGGTGDDTLEGGAGNDKVNGDSGNDRLAGGAGIDTLDGGTGADVMGGGAGNDTYRVDHTLDQAFEDTGGGIDVVLTSVSYALTEGSEINALRTRLPSSTAPTDLTGNSFGQSIQGNNGSNVIAGRGGNDTLTGRAGADFFLFDTALNRVTNVDTLTDFSRAADTIRLDNEVFAGLTEGVLAAGAFNTGTAARQPDDRIVYNTATGDLIFDVNGSAAGGATKFAKLTGSPALGANDFVVV